MTLDELKVEVDKLGYRLIPKPVYIKLLPCTCGCNRREHWYGCAGERFYKCQKCGKRSPSGENENDAKRLWNEMILEER